MNCNGTTPITVVTGSRAEFGLLNPVMRAIQREPALQLSTLVTGTHLTTGSLKDIRDAGYRIDSQVVMQQPGVSGRWADAEALGRGVVGMSHAFAMLGTKVVIVLGDRIEAFAAASAASVAGLFLGHIHGGDRASGVADEAMRHAITKLAHLHFAATITSGERIEAMGERPDSIHVVGSPAIDDLDAIMPASDGPEVMVMMHPIGDNDAIEQQRMAAILRATRPYNRIIMSPNDDPGSSGIVQAIKDEQSTYSVHLVKHLPRARFVSMLKSASVLIGNSSAGLIESPAVGTPSINVGQRQQGRERPPSVFDLPTIDPDKMSTTLKMVISTKQKDPPIHPYGDGLSGKKIAQTLATTNFADMDIRKCCRY